MFKKYIKRFCDYINYINKYKNMSEICRYQSGICRAIIKEKFPYEKISKLLDLIKSEIINQVKKELDGSEKKSNVDKAVIFFVKTNFTSSNIFINAVINILIDYIPIFTQHIYDYLKKRVDGLTEV